MQDAAIISKEGMKAGWEMENAAKVPQEGKVISTTKYKPSGWYKATVPGTVLTTLVNNGVYPEPLYGENNRPEVIPEYLCHTDWWYRNEVMIPDSYKNKTILRHSLNPGKQQLLPYAFLLNRIQEFLSNILWVRSEVRAEV